MSLPLPLPVPTRQLSHSVSCSDLANMGKRQSATSPLVRPRSARASVNQQPKFFNSFHSHTNPLATEDPQAPWRSLPLTMQPQRCQEPLPDAPLPAARAARTADVARITPTYVPPPEAALNVHTSSPIGQSGKMQRHRSRHTWDASTHSATADSNQLSISSEQEQSLGNPMTSYEASGAQLDAVHRHSRSTPACMRSLNSLTDPDGLKFSLGSVCERSIDWRAEPSQELQPVPLPLAGSGACSALDTESCSLQFFLPPPQLWGSIGEDSVAAAAAGMLAGSPQPDGAARARECERAEDASHSFMEEIMSRSASRHLWQALDHRSTTTQELCDKTIAEDSLGGRCGAGSSVQRTHKEGKSDGRKSLEDCWNQVSARSGMLRVSVVQSRRRRFSIYFPLDIPPDNSQ